MTYFISAVICYPFAKLMKWRRVDRMNRYERKYARIEMMEMHRQIGFMVLVIPKWWKTMTKVIHSKIT